MDYYLQEFAVGKNRRIVISEQEFNELRMDSGTLTIFFTLTENYRVVVESYRAVEKAKHDAELDHILYSRIGYDEFSDDRVALNSPIVGYLANARYFIDSTDKILPKVLSHDQFKSFTKFRSNIYDSTYEYKFVEALRNYVQHRELPVHNVTYHNYVEDSNNIETSDKVTSLSLTAARQKLKEDKKFKKTALQGMPEAIDIIYCIRFHMEGMWKLHNYLIHTHSDLVDKGRDIVFKAIKRFDEIPGERSFVFHAIASLSEMEIAEKIPLLLEWDNSRIKALEKIGNLNNLHKRYVTGKIQKT